MLLFQGISSPGSSELVIKSLSILLVLWAFAYTVFSTVVAIKEFDQVGISKPTTYLLSSLFLLVYFVMFVAEIRLGFDKIA